MNTDRSTHWSLTINNPTPADEEAMNIARQKGWTVQGQLEQGGDGTPHYQLYINTRTQVRFSALKKIFARAHIEAARNPAALQTYVTKTDTAIGQLPAANAKFATATQLFEWFGEWYNRELDDRNRHVDDRHADNFYAFNEEQALRIFDRCTHHYIRQGYMIEQLAVNPQVRAAIKRFHESIAYRQFRQTLATQLADDRTETISVQENITDEERIQEEESTEED